MKIFLITLLLLLQFSIGENLNYGDKQIVLLLKNYFQSSLDAPKIIGHRFYKIEKKIIFQIEIKTNIESANKALLFGFKAISNLSNIAKKKFTHAIVVIHFENEALPIIAESNLNCSESFFINKIENEQQWRKNCLTIRNY